MSPLFQNLSQFLSAPWWAGMGAVVTIVTAAFAYHLSYLAWRNPVTPPDATPAAAAAVGAAAPAPATPPVRSAPADLRTHEARINGVLNQQHLDQVVAYACAQPGVQQVSDVSFDPPTRSALVRVRILGDRESTWQSAFQNLPGRATLKVLY